jgi:hypothetical protein
MYLPHFVHEARKPVRGPNLAILQVSKEVSDEGLKIEWQSSLKFYLRFPLVQAQPPITATSPPYCSHSRSCSTNNESCWYEVRLWAKICPDG